MKFHKYHALLQLAIVALFIAILTGCASPATKDIALNKHEIRQEQQAQREMAQRYPAKKITTRQHQDLGYYRDRLNKVAPSLMQAAKGICKNGNCIYTFKIVDTNILNAWADGKTVNVTPLMMDFLDTDKELALILAHELAHNIMGHISKKKQNTIIGAVLDMAARAGGVDTQGVFTNVGAQSYSQGFENEADYVAIYIMALAKYDISDLNYLWRKMSVQMPRSINGSFFSSHPSNPERFLRMQKTIAEVKTKKTQGQQISPDYKP